jgi:hypothetical protein
MPDPIALLRRLLWVVALSLVVGCASPVIDESTSEISLVRMSCKKPYPLERDCSWISGPTRKIEISGLQLKVAGSSDGRVIVVIPDDQTKHAFKGDLPNASVKAAFEVAAELESQGVKIVRQIPIVTSGQAAGYVLELESDGYSLLMATKP